MSTLKASQDLINLIRTSVLNYLYPIGSLYITTKAGNPQSYLGGKWTLLSGGFIYASSDYSRDRGDSGNGTGTNVNSTTLTINQIPSHTHSFSGTTGGTGGGGGHTHGVPYIACIVWKRTG